jgi:hypothetical protein
MFYRILNAPPGYSPEERYMLVRYRTLDFDSSIHGDPSSFFASLEEARAAIPGPARQLPFQQVHQFLELWEPAT